ncbi:hypothetical protein O23A_p2139 [Aeromonas salmonicida]|nr:hypothetical protein O23A_p2139 [Aeromonas salmonicida]
MKIATDADYRSYLSLTYEEQAYDSATPVIRLTLKIYVVFMMYIQHLLFPP